MNAEFHIKNKEIETERLLLRAFKETDLNDFYEYAKIDGVGEMAGWPHHENIEESKKILDRFIKNDIVFAIVYKENNKVIGSLGVEECGLVDKLIEFDGLLGRELGYVLSKNYWGKGIMPEAVKGVIDYLFNDLNLDYITIGHFSRNNQSRRVIEKCGFKPYRKLVFETKMGTEETGILHLLFNPNKKIKLKFSHPETLIWQ